MDRKIRTLNQKFLTLAQEHLLPVVLQKLDEQETFLDNIYELQKQLIKQVDKSQTITEDVILETSKVYTNYLSASNELINVDSEKKDNWNAYFNIEPFIDQLDQVIKALPEFQKRSQSKDRFMRHADDPALMGILKKLKKSVFVISTLPQRISNSFRKLRKKEVKKIPIWQHRIPWRNLVRHHYGYRMILEISKYSEQWLKDYQSIEVAIRQTEEGIAQQITEWSNNQLKEVPVSDIQKITLSSQKIEQTKSQIQNLRKVFNDSIVKIIDEVAPMFSKDASLAGTIELPRHKMRKSLVRRRYNLASRELKNTFATSYNYVFQLQQDWLLDCQILISSLRIVSEYQIIKDIFNKRADEKLLPGIQKLLNETQAIKGRVLKPGDEIKKTLLVEKRRISREMADKIIKPLSDSMIELDFPNLLNGILIKIQQTVEVFDKEFWLIRNIETNDKIKNSDFYLFEPEEIINFEMIPRLQKSFSEIKTRSFKDIDEIRNEIDHIDNILIFNLESAIDSLESPESAIENAQHMVEEGIVRTLNKIEAIQRDLLAFFDKTDDNLRLELSKFNQDLQSLSDNENAILLRLKITKARTLQQTIRYGKAVKRKGRIYLLKSLVYLRLFYRKATDRLLPWQKRIGLSKAEGVIGTELSEFLSFAYEAIGKLPAIYQRLYSIKPLEDQELFVGRTAEMRLLNKSFDSWEQGRYAATMIVGEKWSGRTTLLNIFINQKSEKLRFIRCRPTHNIYEEKDFLKLWEEWLQQGPFDDIEQLVDYINGLPGKRCMVIEDIQNMYIRTIGGFQSLKLFTDLISRTQDSCFWICTSTLYAWQYLENAIRLAEHFGSVITLSELKNEQVTEVILRRNNISGYKIVFRPSQRDEKSRKFLKLSEDERQDYLQNQFFKNLNSFSKSNIALALIYWLLSTKNITETRIEIGYFTKPDFSFLEGLAHTKVLALNNIVLHDGLTKELFAKIMDLKSIPSYRLIYQMIDNGVIVKRGDIFEINPLFYRPTVQMLRTKNFIH